MEENPQEPIPELTLEQINKALMSLLEDLYASGQELGKKTEDLQKAKKALEKSMASFHNIVERSVDGILIVDKDGIVLFVNSATELLFGHKAEKLVNELFGFPIVADKSMEIQIIRKGREIGTGEIRVVETEWEDESAYLVSIRDITERKQAEENQERLRQEITEDKAKTETMVESMADGVIMIDKDKIIPVINRAARRALHIDIRQGSEVDFKDISKSFGYDPTELLRNEEKTFIKNEVSIYDVPYQMQVSSVMESEGKVLGAVVSLRDVSEEKEVDRMKSEFISIVSHELRTPLTSIKNAVDIVLGKVAGTINENQEKFLSMANRNIDRLSGIISELLDVSKIESGTLKVDLRPLNLGVSLDMAIASLTSGAKEKSISIHKEMPSDLPQAYGDSDKLEQIFINLLHNAIKFTPKGGEIRVTADLISEFGPQSLPAVSLAGSEISWKFS